MPNEELEPVVYLNEFCPDLDAFRSTPFCNRFRDELRFDPVEQEQSGRAIAYRGTANRGNPNDVLDDLGDIHGKTFYQKPLGRTTFTAFIRK